MNNPSTHQNDFDGYNEAHSTVEVGIENCSVCSGDEKRDRANRLIADLRRAEAILKRYGLDDHWLTKHRKPKLREIVRSYLINDLKFDEAILKEKTPWLYEPFLLGAEELAKRKKTEKGLVTERGMNWLSLDEGREIGTVEISIDTESMLILDCIAQIAHNTINLVFTKEDIDCLISLPVTERQEVLAKIPAVTFTGDDVRKMIGVKLTSWHIEELFRKVKRAEMKLSKKIFYEDGHWHGFEIYSSFGDLQVAKNGVASKRHNVPEAHRVKHRYTVSLNTVLGAIFLSNISQGKYRLLPQWFYRLSFPRQTLYRAFIVLKKRGKKVDLAHSRECRLLGEPEEPVNITDQVDKFKGHFEKLKEKRLLSCVPEGKGKKTSYKLDNFDAKA